MKRVKISDLPDMFVMSEVLDDALYLLSNAPTPFLSSDFSRMLGIHASVLTRMKLVHNNPGYVPFVNQYDITKVLKYLFQCFPTLVLCKASDGRFIVRLFKRVGNQKLENSPLDIPSDDLFKKSPPKPGSTRWYLENHHLNK